MNNSTFRSKLPPVLLLYFLTMIGFQVAAQSGKVFRDYNGKRDTNEPYNLFTFMRNFLLSLHNKQRTSVLYQICLTLLLFLSSGLFVLQAQTAVCKEFIYLNSGNFNANTAKIHKFQVGSSGPFTEVIVNSDAWYPGASGIDPTFTYPHGLGVDRNGFLYIGNAVFSPNAIRRFDCVGNLKSTSEFVINNPGELLTNIDSYAGFIYSNGQGNKIYKWDPCTGAAMGYVQLDDGSPDWGFSIDHNGKFYVTNTSGKIYAFTPTATDFTSNTTYS